MSAPVNIHSSPAGGGKRLLTVEREVFSALPLGSRSARAEGAIAVMLANAIADAGAVTSEAPISP